MTDHRAEFDAVVPFSNGGCLQVEGFRVDAPRPDVTEDQVAELFVASLGLLMVDRVDLRRLRIFAEPHKGTRGGPSDATAAARTAPAAWRYVELNHVITAGMTTYPGLPGPEITPHLTRDASRSRYDPGTEFAIDGISMVGSTGTCLDSPFHRYAGGDDLSRLPLTSLVDLPAVVVRTVGSASRGVDASTLAPYDVTGCAVLLHTGGDATWGTADYARDAPYLTEAGARWLADRGARLVGIDSVNIDDTHQRRSARALDPSRGGHPGRRAPHRARAGPPVGREVHGRSAAGRGLRDVPGSRVRRGPCVSLVAWPPPRAIPHLQMRLKPVAPLRNRKLRTWPDESRNSTSVVDTRVTVPSWYGLSQPRGGLPFPSWSGVPSSKYSSPSFNSSMPQCV